VIVIGVYDVSRNLLPESQRRREIVDHCARVGLPAPRLNSPGFLEATVEGHELVRKGTEVTLVGHLSDLVAPANVAAGSFSDHEWREGWLAYLQRSGLGWVSVTPGGQSVEGLTLSRTSVIRSYQRACATLSKQLTRIRSSRQIRVRTKEPGYVCGRPPYGYKVENGHLAISANQSSMVKQAFDLLRQGWTNSRVATELQKQAQQQSTGEWWDAVKVRRLRAHARLYCRGEYTSPAGTEVCCPSLAFLPREWEKEAAAVPSVGGRGKLGAQPLPH
jgi:hypothetical protein